MQEQHEKKVKFPDHLVELALQEPEVKDQIWVLITRGDKSRTITFREMEELSEVLALNLCKEEISSVLFWGKYGNSKDFKKIQSIWLEVQTSSSDLRENDDDSKVESDSEISIDKKSLRNIEISYADFCEIFERNERNCKRRFAKKIDLRNVK